LFLASSVFVKKPERIMALSLIMVLCLLVYRLAECATPGAFSGDRPNHSRSGSETDCASDHALGVPVF
jgi:hypothetical protein